MCVVLSVGTVAVLAANAFPLGVPGEWTWDYHWTGRQREVGSPILAFAAFALCVALVANKLRKAQARRAEQAMIVGTLVVLAGVLQIGVAHLGKIGIGDFAMVTLAPWSNGYCFRASRVGDVGEFLSRYHARMGELGPHVRTHPPGAVVFYWTTMRYFRAHEAAAARLLAGLHDTAFDPGPAFRAFEERTGASIPPAVEAAAWTSSMLLMLAACLTPVPVYFLAKRLHGQTAAFIAAALVCVLPGFLVFTPATDQLLCPLAALVALLCAYGTDRGRVWPWFVAGLLLAAGLFVSLSVLPLALLAGLYAMFRPCGTRRRFVRVRQFGALALAVVALFVALRLGTGLRPLAVYGKLLHIARQATRDAYDSRAATMTYWKWIWWNLGDVVIFAGLAVCVLYAAAWARRLGRTGLQGPEGKPGPAEHFHLAFAIMLLALNFSGVTLGEVGRLWLQFMPFIAILAAAELDALFAGRVWPGLVVMACQMAVAIVLKLRMSWV